MTGGPSPSGSASPQPLAAADSDCEQATQEETSKPGDSNKRQFETSADLQQEVQATATTGDGEQSAAGKETTKRVGQEQSDKEVDKEPERADGQLTNLIVNYLPQSMSQEEIRTLFSSIGEVESCKLIRDKSTINQSLGYGFVNYVRPEDAQRAIKSFNGLRLQNKTIKVSYARPSSESIKGANLYVSGLPKSMTQLELEQLFKPHGKIITSRILCDNLTGISKGVDFVRFDQRFEAERAIEALNNTYIQVQNNRVQVSRTPYTTSGAPLPQQAQAQAQAQNGAQQQPDATKSAKNSEPPEDSAQSCLQTSSSSLSSCQPLAAPIIVKFANSPASNPQKQLQQACAVAGGGGGTASGPGSAGSAAAAAAAAAAAGAGLLASLPSAAGAGLSAYLAASSARQQAAAAGRFGGAPANDRISHQHQQQGGPIYHYPANRFRFSPMAAPHDHFSTCLAAAAAASLPQIGPTNPVATLNPAQLLPIQQQPSQVQQQQDLATGRLASYQLASGSALNVQANIQGWCLFVYNLAPEVEESVIWKLFGPFGAVQQVNLAREPQTNKCRGFAFVTMSDYGQALQAIQSLNGFTLANRVLQVSFKTSKMRSLRQPTSV